MADSATEKEATMEQVMNDMVPKAEPAKLPPIPRGGSDRPRVEWENDVYVASEDVERLREGDTPLHVQVRVSRLPLNRTVYSIQVGHLSGTPETFRPRLPAIIDQGNGEVHMGSVVQAVQRLLADVEYWISMDATHREEAYHKARELRQSGVRAPGKTARERENGKHETHEKNRRSKADENRANTHGGKGK